MAWTPQPRGSGRSRARGWVRELLVLVILLGFAVQSATPALALVARGSDALAKGPLGAFLCHVPQPGESDSAGGEVPAKSDDCCLICQAAQLAKGALPPQTLQVPTADAAGSFEPVCLWVAADGNASLHKLPRAPPAG